MDSDDAKAYVESLITRGLSDVRERQAQDFLIVDQLLKTAVDCDWAQVATVPRGG